MHKIRTFFYISLSLFLLISCTSQSIKPSLPKGVTLIEQVKADKEKVVIPYHKYRLDNGLTVILHQDHSDPLVHVDVTYHVGSAREQLGKSGFAHFFEHMMFQGSKHVADEQHFKIVTESGGNLNGSTTKDLTNYYETVPNNQLEKMLWLESDRMGFLLDAITEEKFEVQRATVKNERAQNIDNRPYGRVDETINQMIYPRQHPYFWPVIGFMSDLERGTLTDLKQFFVRWYGPNNAVLTIGGDFDETQTLAWVAKYFGELKAGPAVNPMAKKSIRLVENRYYTLTDNISLPLLYISFPTVYGRHEDEAALDVLANILGNGPTSLLYQHLVKTGIAVQAGASHPCKELACKMNFYALPNPQQSLSLAKLKKAFEQTLLDFEQRGVNDEDLLKTKVNIETQTIYGLQSVAGKVSSLAGFETFVGNANYTQQELDRYNKITKADVMRVYQQYIKNKGAAVLSVIPQGLESAVAHKDNFTLPDISNPPNVNTEKVAIIANQSSFDRNIMPPSGDAPTIKVPPLWRKKFTNGLQIIGSKNSETPTVSLLLSIEGGSLLDPIEKSGLAALTAALMEEGTTNYLKEELSNELAKLGSNISIGASGRYTYIQVSSLTKNLDATINLMLDVMFNPAFKQADFDRVKNQWLQNLQQSLKDPATLASKATKQVLYGANNRIGLPTSGTIKTISAITLDDVKSFYKKYFSPHYSNLTIVGDVDKNTILDKIDYLQHWRIKNYQIPTFNAFSPLTAETIYFIDVPEAKQASIRYIRRAMPYDATGAFFKATLMNYPLGGAFNSRINLNLREDKGYTYGAHSSYNGGKTLGSYGVSSSVKQKYTADAMQEIMKEIALYQAQGMSEQEANFMRKAITQSEALSYETPQQKSSFLRQLIQYNLPENYGEQQSAIIKTISVSELNNIAEKELAKKMQWIVVGNGQQLKPQLQSLGLNIIELKLAP